MIGRIFARWRRAGQRKLCALCLLVAAFAAAAAAYRIAAAYETARRGTERDLVRLAGAFESHVHRTFRRLDQLSLLIIDDVQKHGSPEDLTALLRQRQALDEAIVRIALIGPDGEWLASSLGPSAEPVDPAYSDYFAHHSRPGAEPVFISDPVRERGDAGWSFAFTRRISRADGGLAGIVLIGVSLRYFRDFYASISPEEDVVALLKTNGVLLARSVQDEPAPATRVPAEAVPGWLRGGDVGVRVGQGPDGVERIFAYRRVRSFPLVVVLGRPLESAFAAARAQSWPIGIGLALLLVLLASLAALLRLQLLRHRRHRRTRAALVAAQKERAFLASILEANTALIAVFDGSGRRIVASRTFAQLFGDTGTAAGRGADLATILGTDSLPDLGTLPASLETSLNDLSGERRRITWSLTVLRDRRGSPTHIVAVGFDDTNRRAAELTLYQAGRLLTLGEMTTGLAHEFNQPLMIIHMAVDNMLSRLKAGSLDPDYARSKLERVKSQVKRAAGIVDGMRIFGRRGESVTAAVPVGEVVDGVVGMLGSQLKGADIQIDTDCPPDSGSVQADRALLAQAIANLLLNARDAIQSDRARRKRPIRDFVAIRALRLSGTVVIEIGDSGGGVPAAIIDKIFDPFFTTKPPGQGIGLGLSLSYGIVKDFGGRIEVRNGEFGAVFSIILPAAATEGGSGEPGATLLAAGTAGGAAA